MSANIRPELMQPTDWDFLAALVRWQRHNKQASVDARMIGGKPERREAYGYMFHQEDRDLYCVRNPWIEARSMRLPARVREAVDVQMIYPRRSRVVRIQPDDDGATIVLGPYETMFLETVPAFPVFRAGKRDWSQILQPLKLFEDKSGNDTSN